MMMNLNQPPQRSKKVKSEYDDDEFVGFDAAPPKKVEPPKDFISEKLAAVDTLPTQTNNYILEMVYLFGIAVYILNYWIGKRKNEAIAAAWAESVAKILMSNFAKVGTDSPKISVVKESQSLFKVTATGRINCAGLQATLELRKRHDLFSLLLEFFSKSEDLVIIDIAMNDDAMEPLVFAVVKRKEERRYKSIYKDVSQFAPAMPFAPLPPTFTVFSESEELLPAFLSKEVLSTLANYEAEFVKMHFTDVSPKTAKYKKILQFVFRIPNGDMSKLITLTKMALHFIDQVAATQLTKLARQKVDKIRAKATEAVMKETLTQRQELIQQKKIEKKQKELAEIDTLTPEEQRKREEKNHKKELKKKQAKFKVSFG